MLQAGRYDPEYRKIKEKSSLLEICQQPGLAAEVTMMLVKKLAVDVAILYSDIMSLVAAIGVEFDIKPNVGPVIANPIRTPQDVQRLQSFDPTKHLAPIFTTIRILNTELQVPLITFTGASSTLARVVLRGHIYEQKL